MKPTIFAVVIACLLAWVYACRQSAQPTTTEAIRTSSAAIPSARAAESIYPARGTILREVWTEVPGVRVADLIADPRFPDHPSETSLSTSFEAPQNWADGYGARMRGHLHPPATGSYTFWIASDDHSELWLSTDDSITQARRIAYVDGWTGVQQWDKWSWQQSAPITLTEGRAYYIEALHKEGTINDHLAIAWSGPGIDAPVVIEGRHLSPWTGDSAGVLPTAPMITAEQWYVGEHGDDRAAGNSPANALRTLRRASQLVNPGDTVWILDGTYVDPDSPERPALSLMRPGTSEGWITWRAMPGHRPELRGQGWSILAIRASYQIVDGLTITGNNDRLTLADAEADYAAPGGGSGLFNTSGVSIDSRGFSAPLHHIVLRNLHVRRCSGGGIASGNADLITIESCLVEDCAWFGRYAQSGISIFEPWHSGHEIASPYRIVIRNNIARNNMTLVRWIKTGDFSDGNGIIIDEGRHSDHPDKAYSGRILVAGNLSTHNGGSGIHVYKSDHVDLINNTAYHNSTRLDYGEIFASDASDVRIINNIMYARDGGKINTAWRNVDVVYQSNLFWNGTFAVPGEATIIADPQFITAGTDPAHGDFRLAATSPAIGSAVPFPGVTDQPDLDGTLRPQGGKPDRGAFEHRTSD